jgi:predicted alpha/beta superfamily hydrolase
MPLTGRLNKRDIWAAITRECKKQEIMFNIDATYQRERPRLCRFGRSLAGFQSSITGGNHPPVWSTLYTASPAVSYTGDFLATFNG